MKFSAVIFDLDGTLLINEEVYAKAFTKVLKKHGIKTKNSKHPQTPGIGIRENWKNLKNKYQFPNKVTITQLVHETQDAYHSMLDQVRVRPGFNKLYETLTKKGVALALATSNDWWLVEDELEDLSLQKYFQALVTGEEVAFKKPAPDIFFETARKIGKEPEECIVLEDSIAGITAAKDAGMKAVAVLTSFSKPEDFPKADLVVSGFDKLSPKVLNALFE